MNILVRALVIEDDNNERRKTNTVVLTLKGGGDRFTLYRGDEDITSECLDTTIVEEDPDSYDVEPGIYCNFTMELDRNRDGCPFITKLHKVRDVKGIHCPPEHLAWAKCTGALTRPKMATLADGGRLSIAKIGNSKRSREGFLDNDYSNVRHLRIEGTFEDDIISIRMPKKLESLTLKDCTHDCLGSMVKIKTDVICLSGATTYVPTQIMNCNYLVLSKFERTPGYAKMIKLINPANLVLNSIGSHESLIDKDTLEELRSYGDDSDVNDAIIAVAKCTPEEPIKHRYVTIRSNDKGKNYLSTINVIKKVLDMTYVRYLHVCSLDCEGSLFEPCTSLRYLLVNKMRGLCRAPKLQKLSLNKYVITIDEDREVSLNNTLQKLRVRSIEVKMKDTPKLNNRPTKEQKSQLKRYLEDVIINFPQSLATTHEIVKLHSRSLGNVNELEIISRLPDGYNTIFDLNFSKIKIPEAPNDSKHIIRRVKATKSARF